MLIVFKKQSASATMAANIFFFRNDAHCGLDAWKRLETFIPDSRTLVFCCSFRENPIVILSGKIT